MDEGSGSALGGGVEGAVAAALAAEAVAAGVVAVEVVAAEAVAAEAVAEAVAEVGVGPTAEVPAGVVPEEDHYGMPGGLYGYCVEAPEGRLRRLLQCVSRSDILEQLFRWKGQARHGSNLRMTVVGSHSYSCAGSPAPMPAELVHSH